MTSSLTFVDQIEIKNKRVLLREDFDVSLNQNATIADDERIRTKLPTIKLLLTNGNRLICVAKLNRPKERNEHDSLRVVVERLQELLPETRVTLVPDFLTADRKVFDEQKPEELLVLENIRFYPEEKKNDPAFAAKLAALADVYVNDAFAMCHRTEASMVGVPKLLPSYGGLLLQKELEMIRRVTHDAKHPVVAILGGAKISTKIDLIGKLMEIADTLLIGGGLANTFICAQGYEIGKSFCEYDEVKVAQRMLFMAAQKNTAIVLPQDAVIARDKESIETDVRKIEEIPPDFSIYDIGPETQAQYGAIINQAKTVVWNGPVGYFENSAFRRGTDFIYYTITQNKDAVSIVGGGDTISAISKKEYLDKITHISTGGGAMLEFIEKGTLPALEAMKGNDVQYLETGI